MAAARGALAGLAAMSVAVVVFVQIMPRYLCGVRVFHDLAAVVAAGRIVGSCAHTWHGPAPCISPSSPSTSTCFWLFWWYAAIVVTQHAAERTGMAH